MILKGEQDEKDHILFSNYNKFYDFKRMCNK